MILPLSSSLVLAIMVLSLLFLGAWASMFKAAGGWRFELFYFDFAIGLMLTALVLAFTLGDLGYDGFSFLDDLQHAGKRQWLLAVLAGIIFNLGNMLMMGAVSISGMAVAFPGAMGIGILLTQLFGLIGKPSGSIGLTVIGCMLILASVVVSAASYRILARQKHEQLARAGLAKSTRRPNPLKGIILIVVSGILFATFSGMLTKSREGEVGLGPYGAGALFALGVFLSTFVFNIFLMNLPLEGEPLDFATFFNSRPTQHLLGITGGVLWYLGTLAALIPGTPNIPDSAQPLGLTRVLLLQGSPVVAAILGIVFWRELKDGDMRVKVLALLMLVLFVCGLTMIGIAPSYLRKV